MMMSHGLLLLNTFGNVIMQADVWYDDKIKETGSKHLFDDLLLLIKNMNNSMFLRRIL
jgi:hypothetical protein